MTRRGVAGLFFSLIAVLGSVAPGDDWLKVLLDVTAVPFVLFAVVDWAKAEYALNGDQAYYLALALAFALPGGAYLAQSVIGAVHFDWAQFGAAVGLGKVIARQINRSTEDRPQKGAQERAGAMLDRHVTTPLDGPKGQQ